MDAPRLLSLINELFDLVHVTSSPPTACVMTAFFDRPTKRFTFRCCLIYLKNSSICHRDLYISSASAARACAAMEPPLPVSPITGVTSTGTRPSQVPVRGWGYFLAAFFLRSAQ